MKHRTLSTATLALLLLCLFSAPSKTHAQADPGATQPMQLSVFGAGSGVYTGLASGRNVSLTAGVDLGFGTYTAFGIHPSIEIRGTKPIEDGKVVAEENVLGGIKLDKRYNRYHPYVNLLYGRGELNYYGKGYPSPDGTLLYQQTYSNLYSFGGGVDIDLTEHFAFKADIQTQSYKVPVTTSGTITSTPISFGVIYRFNFNKHGILPAER